MKNNYHKITLITITTTDFSVYIMIGTIYLNTYLSLVNQAIKILTAIMTIPKIRETIMTTINTPIRSCT